MKPHKISSYSVHSEFFYFHFFYPLSNWVEILWGFTKFFFKQILKVSAFYLEKQKSFIPKKKKNKQLSISKQKSFVYRPNFQWRFWGIPCYSYKSFKVLKKHLAYSKQSPNDILSICFLFFYCSKIHSPWRKTLASLNHATTPKKPSSPKWNF